MSTYRLLGKLMVNSHTAGGRKWTYLFPAAARIAHTKTCPTLGSKPGASDRLTRNNNAPVRLCFVPETFFTFFKPKTGITGPYVFLFVVANYLLSKEIYVMEHEYYSGLSILVMVIFGYKTFSTPVAKWLDSEVDAVANGWQKLRSDELNSFKDIVRGAQDAVMRAEAQSLLMAAKKENVQMQIEAIFRERSMFAYESVKNRMEYHIKRYQSEGRIQQKWMIGWILENVRKSITPEFQKQAFDAAIANLETLASSASSSSSKASPKK